RRAIHRESAADDRAVRAIPFFPHAVAEDDRAGRARRILVGAECPPDVRLDAKHGEEIPRDELALETDGLLAVRDVDAPERDRRQLVERGGLGLEILERLERHR